MPYAGGGGATTVGSAGIEDGSIVNADVSASAAIATSKIDGLDSSLALKAPLASPTFTGTVTAPALSLSDSLTFATNSKFIRMTRTDATTYDAIGLSAANTLLLQPGAAGDLIQIGSAGGPIELRPDTTTGIKIGTATTQKIGFYNAAPVVQQASADQASVATTAATNVTPFGYTTAAQANAIVTLLNRLRLDLVTLGLIKGAA